MNITDLLDIFSEGRSGYKKGREVYTSKEGSKKVTTKSRKGRVKTFANIKTALDQGFYGQIFSTKAADRLYVISKGKWGKKSGRGKIAKGFTPGVATPKPGRWPQVKGYSIRTQARHSGRTSKRLEKKYGPGAKKDK